jgi:hypothetical protein
MPQDFKWKDSEKKIANRVYEKARLSELGELIRNFKAEAAAIDDPDQLWNLIEEMKTRRCAFEQKYDYRYSVLVTVFARLVGEGRISEADLQGLDSEKIVAILRTADFFSSNRN